MALQGEMDTSISFSTIENGSGGLMVVVWLVEDAKCGGNGNPVSSSSSVMTMSGEEMDLMVVIPHVKNGDA